MNIHEMETELVKRTITIRRHEAVNKRVIEKIDLALDRALADELEIESMY